MTEQERFDAFARQMGHRRPDAMGQPVAGSLGKADAGAKGKAPARETGAGAKEKAPVRETEAGAKEKTQLVRETERKIRDREIVGKLERELRERTLASRAAEQSRRAQEASEKTRPNKLENNLMIDLMILRNALAQRMDSVKERIKRVNPNGWRDLRLLYALTCRIQEQLLQTMPDSRRDYYTALAAHGRYRLDIQGPIRPESFVLISDKHLGEMLEEIMEVKCLMCMKDGAEIEACPIRQTLLEVGPPTRIRTPEELGKMTTRDFGCEYCEAARQLVRGESVTV